MKLYIYIYMYVENMLGYMYAWGVLILQKNKYESFEDLLIIDISPGVVKISILTSTVL